MLSSRTIMSLLCIIQLMSLVSLAPPTVLAKSGDDAAKVSALESRIASLTRKSARGSKLKIAELKMQLGCLYQDNGDFQKSEMCFTSALKLREEGEATPSLLAESMLKLGDVLRAEAKFTEAEAYLNKAYKYFSTRSAAEKAAALNRLASLYNNWGQFSKAEKLQRHALSLTREKLTGNDADVADLAVHKMLLADILRQQGKFKEAEPYLKSAVTSLEKSKPDSRELAASINNLGALYFWIGDYQKSEPLLKEGLKLRERLCGSDHIDVANSLGDLAALNYQKGYYKESQSLFEKSLAIREKKLGKNHPLTASTMSNLGNVYASTNQLSKAKVILSKAVIIKEKTLGNDSPDLAQGLNDLAELCIDSKDFQKARELIARAKGIREKAFGKDNPDVAASIRTQARLEFKQGNLSAAEASAKRALEIYSKTLSASHPETLQTQKLLKAISAK